AAARWWHATVSPAWAARRAEALGLLAEAEELLRIVNLVGAEALSPAQRWALESAALIREGVLQQNAMDEVDAYCAPARQFLLLELMLEIRRQGKDLLALGVPVQQLLALPLLAEARRYKTAYGNTAMGELAARREYIRNTFSQLSAEYGGGAP
ncbi:MAG: V-type ATP synthase subunit A, partial [Gallionellaceae bacterium]|nr:V-type ATP synthase subunit A [Gallionellaceae bacterium]